MITTREDSPPGPWEVHVTSWEGKALVTAERASSRAMRPFSSYSGATRFEWLARWHVKRCLKWCARRNEKEARGRLRADRLISALERAIPTGT